MKIALVTDWLEKYAGSEKVEEQILACFPNADVFAVVDALSDEDRKYLGGREIKETFIAKLPFGKKKFRNYLPLMPLAIEQLDVTSYDLVISSSHAVAKGVITSPNQVHVSYVHSPIRYAWEFQYQYLREAGMEKGIKSWLARYILHKIRHWDRSSAAGVDYFIANSNYIAKRIKMHYKRDADVIYPPVDTNKFTCCDNKKDYYLTASRMVPYKRIDLIVKAFNKMPDKKLLVIGDGDMYSDIKAIAGDNIELLGYQSNEVLQTHMQKAKAFIFAAEEDFGIVPVEAQACGTPVIAFGKGGALETVVGINPPQSTASNNNKEKNPPTGVFFFEQTAEAISEAVKLFEAEGKEQIKPADCRKNAEKFSIDVFRKKFSGYILSKTEN